MAINFFIFHGTEGHPGENWFPWLKQELESRGHSVTVPQFPSPPIVPAKINEWFDVLQQYEDRINENSVLIGHSLGGVFTLRVLEKLDKPVQAAFLVGAPIGKEPIANMKRDVAFSGSRGFDFDWEKIKRSAKHFAVYQSDDDPWVGLPNGQELAKHLDVELSFIPNAGHFNTEAGYTKFPKLLEDMLSI